MSRRLSCMFGVGWPYSAHHMAFMARKKVGTRTSRLHSVRRYTIVSLVRANDVAAEALCF